VRDRPHRPRHPAQLRGDRTQIPRPDFLAGDVGRATRVIRRPVAAATAGRSGLAAAHGPEPSAARTVFQSRPYQDPPWLTVGSAGSALLSVPPPDRGTTTYTVSPGST